MSKLKLFAAMAMVSLTAACAIPQQTVNNGPYCPSADPRCPPQQITILAVQEAPVATTVVRNAAPARKVVASAPAQAAVETVTLPGVVPSRVAPPTVDMGRGRPSFMPAEVIPRRADSVASIEFKWSQPQPICLDPRTRQVIINGVLGCTANHGETPKQ